MAKGVSLNISVVGGGISGLVASIYLARAGHKVILFEKNYSCGGLVNSFERDGFIFDGGVPALLNSGIIKPMLKELDVDLEFVENKVSIGVENEIMNVNGRDSFYEYGKMLKKLYPESGSNIDRFVKVVENIVETVEILYALDNPLFVDLRKEMNKYVPWLISLPRVFIKMKQLQMPVNKFVFDILKNESATDIVTQHFFKNTPTFFALSYFYIYNDYIYPKGGIGKFAKALESRAKELGVHILYNTEIEKIEVDKRKLFDKFGNQYGYDKLIWTADLKKLYESSVGVDLLKNKNIFRRFNKEKKQILHGKPAESIFKVFLGVDESPDYFRSVSNPHFFYTPSKIGIGKLDAEELTELKRKMDKNEILSWLEQFCERTSFEISIPVIRDSSLAPKGKTGIIVNFFFDYELTKKIYEKGWYDEFKEEVQEKVIEKLDSTIYPGIKEKILFKFSSTPLTIARYAGTSDGSIVGWSFGQRLPIKNSLTSSSRTSLPNVYKAGQWSYQPAGVSTAILTGKQVALRIMADVKNS